MVPGRMSRSKIVERAEMGHSRSMVRKLILAADKLVD